MECNLKNEICGFSCTGFDGKNVWRKLDAAVETIDCETCHDHAVQLISFLHDVVNAGLGKPVYNEKNFVKIYNQIVCIFEKRNSEPS